MKTIVLSAGHGGSDSGAVANGVREKDPNLSIALACRDYLNMYYEGHRLILPRETDTYMSLPARRDLTARVNADRYVAFHNNYFYDSRVGGFETHLYTGELYGVTRGFRDHLHNSVAEYIKTLGVGDRGKKFTAHDESRMMQCPTVIMEYMFITNPAEAQLLKSRQVLTDLGIYTARGLAKDLNLPRKQVQPTPWPVYPIPKIERTVGIEHDGKRTKEVGFLAHDPVTGTLQTYARMGFTAPLPPCTVTGHDDHVKLATRR